MKTAKFLAILVATMCLQGCFLTDGIPPLTGCPDQNNPVCSNYVPPADTTGDVVTNNDSTDAETDATTDIKTKEEVCKENYPHLEDTMWTCHVAYDYTCILEVVVLDSGVCGILCPEHWQVQADTILYSPNQIVYDAGLGAGSQTCDKTEPI